MAEYIMSSSKAEFFEWHILLVGGKNLIQVPQKTDGSFHTKLLVLDCWLVNFVFQKYAFGLLLSSYFRSDVWYLELKSKGVMEIDQW